MVYTLGPLHDLLSGSGTVSLNKPAGLLLTVLGYPIGVGVQPGTPTTLHRFGHITPGDPNGWYPKVQIIQTTQLVLPMPADCTICGYDTAATSGLSIRELVGGPVPNNTLQPWDRNMAAWGYHAAPVATGNVGTTTTWSYTVPAGKKLWLSSAYIRHNCSAVSTAFTYKHAAIDGPVSTLLQVHGYANAVGDGPVAELNPGGLVLKAGEVISARYQCVLTGGSHGFFLSANGFLFDA